MLVNVNNKYDAEYEYNKKIKNDNNYLESVNIRSEDGKNLKELFKEITYSAFGVFFPSQESKKLGIATGAEDMPKLESEEDAKERQIRTKLSKEAKEEAEKIMKRIREKSSSESDKEEKTKGEELKIMTPNQILTRLRTLLASKQAGNNSQQLDNEIR